MRSLKTSDGGAGQLDLFVGAGSDIAARDAQDLMAWPFFSLAKTKRVKPIDFRMGEVAILVEATAEHGMATIWDADVLIWVASQIVEARDAGKATSRLIAATPHEILTFTGAVRLRPRVASIDPNQNFKNRPRQLSASCFRPPPSGHS